MGWVLMSEREVHRAEVLSGVVAGRMSTSEAASILCLSERQVRSTIYREIGRNRFVDPELPYLSGY